MLEAIADTTARTAASTGVEAIDPEVMAALDRVPRHEFVPTEIAELAYENRPLPIGHGQTISQPYIVAPHDPPARARARTTGCSRSARARGYQAAVLAELVDSVPHHRDRAAPSPGRRPSGSPRLGYDNVEAGLGDGYYGWPEAAPFQAIIVTAAASHVPPPLVAQLAPDGGAGDPGRRAVLRADAPPRAQAGGRRR